MKVRKRNILSVLITAFLLFALNKFWLVFKPMDVQIYLTGKGNCCIEAQLNKKPDTKFKKIKSGTTTISLDKVQKAEILVERSKHPRALKLRIFLPYSKDYSPITINKIKIGNNYAIKNLKNIEISGGKIIENADSLSIKPLDNVIVITFNEKFNVFTSVEFDFELFIIISILTFLLLKKLFGYIGDYSSNKGKSVFDVIFLVIFFGLLLIPASSIDNEEISKKENRALAKWKPIITDNNEINYNFGNDFNSWFNDRFNKRASFIKLHSLFLSLFCKDFYETKNVIYNKKYDFAYNKGLNSQDVYLRKIQFSPKELDDIYITFENLEKYCRENNVKLYLILSNDKEGTYPEYYPNYYTPENNKPAIEQIKEKLSKNKNLEIISTQENILKAKKEEMVFEPYDTHLNGKGAYIEYKTIIDKTKQTFGNIKVLNLSDIEIVKSNVLCDTLPPEKYINEKNQYSETIKIKNSTSNLASGSSSYYINKNSNNKLKAVIIGDSFHSKYLNLLAESFYSLKSKFIGGGDDFVLDDESKKSLFSEIPDILYIETSERFLLRLKNLDSLFDIFDKKYRSK